MTEPFGKPLQRVRLKREPALFVCSKCLKRASMGKPIRQAIKQELQASRQMTGRKRRLVRVSCLGVCPKQGVVVATPHMIARGEIRVVRDPDQISSLLEHSRALLGREAPGGDRCSIPQYVTGSP